MEKILKDKVVDFDSAQISAAQEMDIRISDMIIHEIMPQGWSIYNAIFTFIIFIMSFKADHHLLEGGAKVTVASVPSSRICPVELITNLPNFSYKFLLFSCFCRINAAI